MSLSSTLLVARRDYFAYVGAWGFWLSLLTAPLIIALLIFAPIILARAEPSRVLAVVAENAADAETVTAAFEANARREARGEVRAYLDAAAPTISPAATEVFDAAPNRDAAIAAARAVVAAQAPSSLRAFPQPTQRYQLVTPPGETIEAMRPYLDGTQMLLDGRQLYGALNIRRAEGAPIIEYWSVNLSHDEPSNIARGALRLAMQREALAAQGLAPTEADRIDGLEPSVAQFDPRPSAGEGRVTIRDRAPFYAALALAFILWSVVFSVANMLLSGVIEEKSNKILDTLLTSVSPIELLTGKLLGVAMVSLTLFLFWGALGGTLLSFAAERAGDSILGQVAAAFLEPRLLAAFAIGFIAGYLMYGAIFLALGSLCESIQEAQTLLGPVALVLAVPMLLITPALDNPNAPIVEAASWIPIFTPFLLLVRAPAGLSWAEIAGMGGIMIIAVIVILWLAARVFRAGVVDQVSMANWRGRKNAKE
ncbi:ABC transporter permease [Terricaulis silvestris]|uniref:ABC-2 family transporter protein n=1 Tax=Terricaulis silvestris TaxID=2686094 RepID=A0A6I6MH42_9CAUL|nr:ABC transporter permease [Terricaulis silvestris]QGZ94110.1 ABC-2 family transporter protein [Terricaulis silvestris]